MTSKPYAVGIDIGGASIVAAVVAREDGRLFSSATIPTESQRGIEDGLRRVTALVEDVITQSSIVREDLIGIGIGSTGPLDTPSGTINNPYTLPGWDGIPVARHLSGHFQKLTHLIGDCDVAALGEHWVGAGRGARNMIYITVGTGIGSGIIINNQLHRGIASSACEVGHHVIDLNGPECYCGARGCLEMLAAAPAIVKRAQAVLADSPAMRQLSDDDSERVTAKLVYDAAEQGDEAALQIMRDTGCYLGVGIANVMNMLGPDKVILGGGVMQGWKLIAPPMFETIYARDALVPFKQIEIVRAALGLNAGVTGAAKAIFDCVERDTCH